ncbi:MAG: hypothetical protein IPJ86_07535 [Bacteroidetes bacterium]|nr:hypothetical protein [Bacteroidota bacterium]
MASLNSLLLEIEGLLPHQSKSQPAISGAPVGWHIEHSLLTINRIITALEKSDATGYKSSFKLSKLIVFSMGKIPRGRAKAPGIVQPKQYDEMSLGSHLEKTKEKMQELHHIPNEHYFEHPYFGHLKVKKTIRFLVIHTQHHLSIMNDIVKSTEAL